MMSANLFDAVRSDRRGLVNMDRLIGEMQRRGLDAVVATSPPNVTYSAGSLLRSGALLTFVLTRANGEQTVVINEADAYFFKTSSWVEDVRDFPYAATTAIANGKALTCLRDSIAESLGASARIGLESAYLPAIWYRELERVLSSVSLEDANPVFDFARLVKTPREAEVLDLAAYCTDKAIAMAFAMASPGITERELTSHMLSNLLLLGADGLDHGRALSGEHSTVVHAWPSAKCLTEGEIVHADIGGSFAGYVTDIGRNAVVGTHTAKQHRIYQALYEVQLNLLDKVRPGVTGAELHEFGKRYMKAAGLVHPWGTFGHSIGLSVHEGLELSTGSTQPLEVNMVLNLEPSHIEATDARYHVEDTVLVTDEGPRVLSSYSHRETFAPIR